MPPNPNPGAEEAAAIPPETVLVKRFYNSDEAEMAAAILRANNIPVWLSADNCGGMYSFLDTAQGVRLLARSADADAAKALLAAAPLATGELEPAAPAASAPPTSPPRLKLAIPQIAVGIIVGVLLHLLYERTMKLGTHTYRYDNDDDGAPDEFMVYRDGRCVEHSFDRNFDGKPDAWYYYDAEGNRTESLADDNFDGRIDGTWRYTNGVLAEAKLDTDFSGITDVIQTFRYDQLKQADWRPNGSVVVSRREFFRNGTLIEEWCDTNLDGVFDTTNRFDAFKNRIETNSFKLHSLPTR